MSSGHPTAAAKFLQLDRRRNLGRRPAPRLLSSLPRQAQPALVSFASCSSEMSVGPLCDNRNDARDSDFSTFLNRPFHAIELEDSKSQSQSGGSSSCYFFPKSKFNAIVRNRNDFSMPNPVAACDVEFLSDLSAQHAAEMSGMLAGQRGNIFVDFVGDPTAAGQK